MGYAPIEYSFRILYTTWAAQKQLARQRLCASHIPHEVGRSRRETAGFALFTLQLVYRHRNAEPKHFGTARSWGSHKSNINGLRVDFATLGPMAHIPLLYTNSVEFSWSTDSTEEKMKRLFELRIVLLLLL